MAYQDVACAIPARMASMTAESSTSVFSEAAGTRQSADVGPVLDEGTICLEADVTDASILAELGIHVRNFGVVGEAGTQFAEVAPGTLCAFSPETQLVDGVWGRDSVVSETNRLSAVGAAGTTADRVALAFAILSDLDMRSSPLLPFGSVPRVALPAFPTAQNSQLSGGFADNFARTHSAREKLLITSLCIFLERVSVMILLIPSVCIAILLRANSRQKE